jgi:hypothetical protein
MASADGLRSEYQSDVYVGVKAAATASLPMFGATLDDGMDMAPT